MITARDGAGLGTLVELLRVRALATPDRPTYVFLPDGVSADRTATYAELDLEARSIAAEIQDFAAPGQRALLLYPPGLEFVAAFFGCLYAGVIAVPLYAPTGGRGLARIHAVLGDAAPSLALTSSAAIKNDGGLDKAKSLLGKNAGFLHWLVTDEVTPDAASNWVEPPLGHESVAHLQYTSGSTATPKGVVVTHGNVLHNLMDMDRAWRHDVDGTIVTWLPTFHDMGLVYGVLEPLYANVRCYMMPPVAFVQRPVRWLQAISTFRATHSVAPNFAYDLCVRKIKEEDRDALDLSSWAVAVNGAEPIRRDTLERFADAFEPSGFRRSSLCPGYGLAEATLKVTAVAREAEPIFVSLDADALEQRRIREGGDEQRSLTLVGCGPVPDDLTVAIVDPLTLQRCAHDEIGEIWLSNPSVAAGYWNQPALSEAVFRARLGEDAQSFLRTGDLGFLREGELFVAGRIKDMIIVRGQNHYPQDIEQTVERHPAVEAHGCAAFAIEGAEERLVVVAEVDRNLRQDDQGELIGAVRQAVAEEHELTAYDVVLVRTRAIPRTSSGKIQRRACRQAYLDGLLPREVARARALPASNPSVIESPL